MQRIASLLVPIVLLLGAKPTPPPSRIVLTQDEAPGPPPLTCEVALNLPAKDPAARRKSTISSPENLDGWRIVPPPATTAGDRTPLQGKASTLLQIAQIRRAPARGAPLRITVLGASHTEADFFTGALRRSLQTRWGDGGHGFVLPAAPYRAYRAQDVDLCYSPGWSGDWAGKGGKPHFPGIAGLVVTSSDPDRFGWVGTSATHLHGATVSRWTLFLQGEPGAGDLAVEVDGAEPLLQDTRRAQDSLIALEIQVPPGAHRLTVRPAGNGPVTLLGLSAEAAASGVIVDAMGVRGSTIRNWKRRDNPVFTEGLQALHPDLVVLAYGTNEAMDPTYKLADYKQDLQSGLEDLHQALPHARCILVGPSDRSLPMRDGRVATWERTKQIATIQAEEAMKAGCASWSWQQATGGPGSQASWRQQDPAWVADDWIHFTPAGYEEVAERFLWALDSAG